MDSQAWPHPSFPSPMRITRLALEDLAVLAQPGRLRVIGVQEGTILPRAGVPPTIDGTRVVADSRSAETGGL